MRVNQFFIDFFSLLTLVDVSGVEFDKLNRQIVKILQSGSTPKLYIKAIADLEDFMNETVIKQKSSAKKMNASNAKGFNAVKQRIKKNNKDYMAEIEGCSSFLRHQSCPLGRVTRGRRKIRGRQQASESHRSAPFV